MDAKAVLGGLVLDVTGTRQDAPTGQVPAVEVTVPSARSAAVGR